MKKTYHITPRESSSGKFYFVASIVFLLFWAILLLTLLHSEYRPLFGVILCLGLLGPILYFMQLLFASFYIVLEEDKLTVSNYFIPRWGGCYPLREIKLVLFWFSSGTLAYPYFRVHLRNGKLSYFRSLAALIPQRAAL